MTQCPHCGETSYYPNGPHPSGPCPLLKREHEARMDVLRAAKRTEETRERREFYRR